MLYSCWLQWVFRLQYISWSSLPQTWALSSDMGTCANWRDQNEQVSRVTDSHIHHHSPLWSPQMQKLLVNLVPTSTPSEGVVVDNSGFWVCGQRTEDVWWSNDEFIGCKYCPKMSILDYFQVTSASKVLASYRKSDSRTRWWRQSLDRK